MTKGRQGRPPAMLSMHMRPMNDGGRPMHHHMPPPPFFGILRKVIGEQGRPQSMGPMGPPRVLTGPIEFPPPMGFPPMMGLPPMMGPKPMMINAMKN